MSLLSINDLNIYFDTNDGRAQAVRNVSFDIQSGQKLALVGESGSGKSQIAFSLMGLLAKNGSTTGQAIFENKNLLDLSPKELNRIRAKKIAMIFQDPMSSLNPYLRIETQLTEILTLHEGMNKANARRRALEALEAVHIPDAKNRLRAYPHELSGGMRQRIVIAMALLCNPKLILADEPTTALDVTVQAQIMQLLDDIQKEFGTSILLITHDLGVVSEFCDDAIVLYGGQIMEKAPILDIFDKPSHPYTRGLLKAIPRIDEDRKTLATIAGTPPSLIRERKGCPFAPRCECASPYCFEKEPQLTTTAPIRACLRPVEELPR